MPPKTKISREMILSAAFALTREQGADQLNARSIAEKLGCSTQPVMYNFKTVEEIRGEVYRMADAFHSEYILPKGREANPLLELGLNYIRFAHEEKHLFRFLFQSNSFSGFSVEALMESPALTEILGLVSAGTGCTMQEAGEVFLRLFVSAHGLASLLANNAMVYEEDVFRRVLKNAFPAER